MVDIDEKEFFEKTPSFFVVNGIVHYFHPDQRHGGQIGVGTSVSWDEHGTFVVEYVGSDCAVIKHDAPGGKKFFVAPGMKVWVHNDRTASIASVAM